jgi:hypothetical protein
LGLRSLCAVDREEALRELIRRPALWRGHNHNSLTS